MKEKIRKFYNELIKDKNHRYKSWEHCYCFFSELFTKEHIEEKDLNIASLHLSFYLASWGMYRGSSFLLWKDYLIHKDIVQIIWNNKTLHNQDWLSLTNKEKEKRTGKLFILIKEIKKKYQEKIKCVNGRKKEITPSDTLITKIILGTLGCMPAYDRYFVSGLRAENISYSSLSSEKSFQKHFKKLLEFCEDNKKDFNDLKKEIKTDCGIAYPPMKLIDMYFWVIGFEKAKRDKLSKKSKP